MPAHRMFPHVRSLAASAPCLARAFALLTVTWLGMGCVSKPTIRLNHAEISRGAHRVAAKARHLDEAFCLSLQP